MLIKRKYFTAIKVAPNEKANKCNSGGRGKETAPARWCRRDPKRADGSGVQLVHTGTPLLGGGCAEVLTLTMRKTKFVFF